MAVNTNEVSLSYPQLTSCYAAHGPLPVHGLGVGDSFSTLRISWNTHLLGTGKEGEHGRDGRNPFAV